MGEKKGFDLTAMLGDVSKLDTGAAPREYLRIPLDQIEENEKNEKNGLKLEDIEALADTIKVVGLQQPCAVLKTEDPNKPYRMIAGHRRLAAYKLNRERFPEDTAWNEIPAIVQRPASDVLEELALILTNTTARKLEGPKLSTLIERTSALFAQLQDETGVKLPGKMRDTVAAYLQVSTSKIARLKVIREKLLLACKKEFDKGKVNESVAYALAKLPTELQERIATAQKNDFQMGEWKVNDYAAAYKNMWAIKCKHGEVECSNREAMWSRYTEKNTYHRACDRCCEKCSERLNCKAVCPKFREDILAEKRKNRAATKEANATEKAKQAAIAMQIRQSWARFGEARRAASVSVKEVCEILGVYYGDWKKDEYREKENGERKMDHNSETPYQYALPKNVAALAARFDVSLEYLFCQTDDPRRGAPTDAAPAWREDQDYPSDRYLVALFYISGAPRLIRKSIYAWHGKLYFSEDLSAAVDMEPVAWFAQPDTPADLLPPQEDDEEQEECEP